MPGTTEPTPAQWQRAHQVFEAAIQLPAAARLARAQQDCADDPQVLELVQSLLRADAQTGDLTARVSGEASRRLAIGPQSGDRVGAFRLIRELARGGMGVVWLAERADGHFEQQVAIKLLSTGWLSADAHARFLAERQLQARLEHPHIARLIDGGTTASGVPFLAVEYIDGQAITTYCDQARLGMNERLALFRQVCEAVQYAHRHLIVHRDIKPSNILVTADGSPKLLDFGIAKLTDAAAADPASPEQTQASLRLLTPRYASPEQVKGEPVSTSTDVYALGLLLYELLCGQPPFAAHDTSPAALQQAIVERPPPRPSAALADARDRGELDRIGQQRSTSPRRLRAQLAGDLDTIVAMALRKEPARRYASVEALSADVGRRLRHLPVHARPDAWTYRTGRFLRRNAMASATSAVALALAAAFTVSMVVQSRRIALEQQVATRTADFLVGLLKATDPSLNREPVASVQALLKSGAQRAETELADAPEVQARVLRTLGQTLRTLGSLDDAARLLQRAADLYRQRLGADTLEAAETYAQLGRTLFLSGRSTEALPEFDQAIRIEAALLPATHPRRTDAMNDRTGALWTLGRFREAHSAMAQVVALARQHPDHPQQLAKALSNFALLDWELGLFRSALAHHQEALPILHKLLGTEHSMTASGLNLMGSLLQRLGQPQQALAQFRRAVHVREKALGPEHFNVANDLRYVADGLRDLGRAPEAVAPIERALAICEAALGAEHDSMGETLIVAAAIDHALGQTATARARYQRAIALFEANHDADFPRIADALLGAAALELDVDQPATAQPLLERALQIRTKTYGESGPWVATALRQLALARARLGQTDAALRLARQARALRGPPADDPVAAALDASVLAEVHQQRGEPEAAAPLLTEALAAYTASHGAEHAVTRGLRQRLQALGDPARPAAAAPPAASRP